jgi:hypothetical protein
MTNLALYQIADEYLLAVDKLADLDLDDQTFSDTLESLSGDMEVKSSNVAMFVGNLEGSAKLIREAAKAQVARADAIERRSERIRQYLLDNMLRTGITKIECPYFVLSVQNNPAKVIIDGDVPDEFMRQPEPPPPAPDKKAIGEALKTGLTANWAHLEQGKRLVIK